MASSIPRGTFVDVMKRRKVMLTLKTKLEIIQRLENGETAASLGRAYDVNESTIRTIRKSSEKIKNSVARSTSLAAKTSARVRNPLLEKMEKMLVIWVEDQNQKRIAINSRIIRNKALQFYDRLQLEEGTSSNLEHFLASKGWYEKFRKRQNIQNIKITSEAASVDEESASMFMNEFKALIAAEGYSPRQVFNANEAVLFWKRMPNESGLMQNDLTANDKSTLLLCGNAEGDFKCKLLLVSQFQNSRDLQHLNQKTLPVHWRSNNSAWISGQLFEDWFTDCFCREVEEYCRESGIAFKALLVLDQAPGHRKLLTSLHPNIKVTFLPPNTTTLIQPLDQGVMNTFKINYLASTFSQILAAREAPPISDYWANYNIAQAINNMEKAWGDVKPTTMNAVWKALWEECIHDFLGFVEPSAEITKLIAVARNIGLENLQEAEVEQLLQSYNEELSADELLEMIQIEQQVKVEPQEQEEEEEKFQEDVSMKPPSLSPMELVHFFALAEQLAREAVEMDPDLERSLAFGRNLTSVLTPYRDMYNKLQ